MHGRRWRDPDRGGHHVRVAIFVGSGDDGDDDCDDIVVKLKCAGPDMMLGTDDDILLSTTTDADGRFSFTGVPLGICKVFLSGHHHEHEEGACPSKLTVMLHPDDCLDDICLCVPNGGDDGDDDGGDGDDGKDDDGDDGGDDGGDKGDDDGGDGGDGGDGEPKHFVRGDGNTDGAVNLADAIGTLIHLFVGNKEPIVCMDAADTDDSGKPGLNDPVLTLNYLFRGRGHIGAPYPFPGPDMTPDELDGEKVQEAP